MTILAQMVAADTRIRSAMKDGGHLAGVPYAGATLIALSEGTPEHPIVILTHDVERTFNDCVAWTSPSTLALFPPADTLPTDRVSPGDEVTRHRLTTLARLARREVSVVVTSPNALVRPTVAPGVVASLPVLTPKLHHARDDLIARLVACGYQRVGAVMGAGEMAVRGGIVDLFSPGDLRPTRIEWWGDDIESIRSFDSDTQVSRRVLKAFHPLPALELDLSATARQRAGEVLGTLDLSRCRPEVLERWESDRALLEDGGYDTGIERFFPYLTGVTGTSLLEHIDSPTVLVTGSLREMGEQAYRYVQDVTAIVEQEVERGELPMGAAVGLYSWSRIEQVIRDRASSVVECERVAEKAVEIGWQAAPTFVAQMPAFVEEARMRSKKQQTVLVGTRQEDRVVELLRESGMDPVVVDDLEVATSDIIPGSVIVAAAGLSVGFDAPSLNLLVVTDAELFGPAQSRRSSLARGARKTTLSTSVRGNRGDIPPPDAVARFSLQFAPGDVVTHRDHGVGRFIEMRRVSSDDGEREYMLLEYAEKERLFVPVEHLDRIDRYVGGAEGKPHLSRLGTGEWERTKRRVKERTEEVARELLRLYSRREAASGHAFAPDGLWQMEVEASFPYEETPDQRIVLDDIKKDMESPRPMDRVVCGDVGFGKTEIALRAAFKAAVDGRQVAMLVPTTVLAQQHFQTFVTRLAPFPLTVRQLSRFVSDEEARSTLVGCASGAVDIVIGTHRLLQKDVTFHNLGLVILDEEQRFGVLQKEKFKELRVAVDMLSLSATPIPRTLHMSLAGIRDLSVIGTPPEERQPVVTYVTAYDKALIADVILRELAREGQVFFLHNRVRTIEREAEIVRELVPKARVSVAHGQMDEGALAATMTAFAAGEIDVLCCTTIIESGLDIPNANTIIISDAHRLGLAQIYQLRGRVGRSGQRAYAYILYPPNISLTEKADKRLEVVSELQDLGSGFRLALKDLEIRGAGNLLGEEQHGEIAAVGLEVYNHLLRSAVAQLSGNAIEESPAQISVDLPLLALLPSSYIAGEQQRLAAYSQLAACSTRRTLDVAFAALVDRFGPLPVEAKGLSYSLHCRLAARDAGATTIERAEGAVLIRFPSRHGHDLASIAARYGSAVSYGPTHLRCSLGATNHKGELVANADQGWKPMLMEVLETVARIRVAREELAASGTT